MKKKKKVGPIPKGYPTLTPYLIVRGGAQAIDFYKRAFGAKERMRMPGPSENSIGHAELEIGDALVMLADEFPGPGISSPASLRGTTVSLHVYVKDVDASFKRAVAAGATAVRPPEDKFYGDRLGVLADPFGHLWSLGTHIEDVSPKEMKKRAAEEASKTGAPPPSA